MRDTSKYKGPRGRLGNVFVGETPRDRRNNKRFLAMCALWAICFIAVDVIQEKTSLSSTLAWILAVLPALPAMLALAAYVKFLLEADEMVRAVQLHGLALGFGAAVMVMVGVQWPAEAPSWADSDMILVVMMFGWAFGSGWAMWRLK